MAADLRSPPGGTPIPSAHEPSPSPALPLPKGADRSFVFASGMAALTTVTRLVHTGQRILSGDDIYGGTSRLLSRVLPKQGINVTNIDMTDIAVRTHPRLSHGCAPTQGTPISSRCSGRRSS